MLYCIPLSPSLVDVDLITVAVFVITILSPGLKLRSTDGKLFTATSTATPIAISNAAGSFSAAPATPASAPAAVLNLL